MGIGPRGHGGGDVYGISKGLVSLADLTMIRWFPHADRPCRDSLGHVGGAVQKGGADGERGTRWTPPLVQVRSSLDIQALPSVSLVVNGRHRWCGCSTLVRAVLTARFDADDGRFATNARLHGDRVDNGVVPVDGRGDAATGQTRRHALTCEGTIGQARVGRVSKIGHEEMLILMHHGGVDGGIKSRALRQRRYGGNEETGRRRGRAIGDARNVSNLNDVRGSGEDGGVG